MTLIDGDKIVTAQLYDDEHEEFTEKKMSIIDLVNTYTDEGVTTADDVLDKITEIIEPLRHLSIDEMSDIEWQILQIIDKYNEEE